MADNKGKTKATILHELESIKGLLLEDDEIPILQEAIADTETVFERPLPKRDLDELHDVFQALSHSIRTASDKIGTPASPSFSLSGKTVMPEPDNNAPIKVAADGKQGSLFEPRLDNADRSDDDRDIAVDRADDEASAEETKNSRGAAKRHEHAQSSQPLNYAVSKSITPPARPAAAKASGENPFLPQHIRARLHGNNPPPLFNSAKDKNPAPAANKPAVAPLTRQQLIRDVVAAVLPDIEQELRQRLQTLTDEQLEQLLSDED